MSKFIPNIRKIEDFNGLTDIVSMNLEPEFWSAPLEFVFANAGPLTKRFLATLPMEAIQCHTIDNDLYAVVDTRIHMLSDGMYPAIPGWHCDAVPRKDYKDQPDLSEMENSKDLHFVGTISTEEDGVSNTQYLANEFEAKDLTDKEPVWRQISKQINKNENNDILEAKDGEMYMFNTSTLHRAMPAKTRGWRLFFRLSLYRNKPLGGFKKLPSQVYMIDENGGW